ncbi:hypothetical protein ACIBBG_33000 [Micromonospora chersina]|uniref:helix-turn-helix domain-containing protein n=1 Tax=Micromonospora chersina TaxID=47854 RepID=UPI0037990B05
MRVVRTYLVLPEEFPGGRGAPPDEGAAPGAFWAVELGAGTAWCAPSPEDAGNPPTGAQLERSAGELADGAGRIRRTVLCELQRLPAIGREIKERIEALTDKLAAPAYHVLTADDLDELIAGLEPIATAAQEGDD